MVLRMLIGIALTALLYGQDASQNGQTPGQNVPDASQNGDAVSPNAQDVSQAEYAGPSVLSRGLSPSVFLKSSAVKFRPYIAVNGICEKGLTAVSVDANGRVPNRAACGVEASVGVYGSHQWKTTTLGLRYGGNFRHYPTAQYFDGTDQSLGLDLSHRLSRRTTFTLREMAGTFATNYWVPTVGGVVYTNGLQLPTNQVFDNSVEFGNTTADLTVQLSPRWSFDIGGIGFIVRQRSSALYGSEGGGAHGDLIYRYSRFGSIGLVYQFIHFGYTRAFGASDLHMTALVYSLRLTKTLEFRLSGGGARVESLGLEQVAVDPIIAAITGQSFGITAAYHLNYVPYFSADISKSFRDAALTASYSRSVTPGNGLYLTSEQDGASVVFNYTGVRRWTANASAGYSRLIPLIQTLQSFKYYSAGVGVTRELARGMGLVMRLDAIRYDNGSILNRDAYRATLGLSWSPGDGPLVLW
jgi:hypothetical protein